MECLIHPPITSIFVPSKATFLSILFSDIVDEGVFAAQETTTVVTFIVFDILNVFNWRQKTMNFMLGSSPRNYCAVSFVVNVIFIYYCCVVPQIFEKCHIFGGFITCLLACIIILLEKD